MGEVYLSKEVNYKMQKYKKRELFVSEIAKAEREWKLNKFHLGIDCTQPARAAVKERKIFTLKKN